MLDLTLLEENQLKGLCVEPLNTLGLFPFTPKCQPLDMFFGNISTFYTLRLKKHVEFQEITLQLLQKAKQNGSIMLEAVKKIFQGSFLEKFKKRIFRLKGASKSEEKTNNSIVVNAEDNTDRKVVAFGTDQSEDRKIQIPDPKIARKNKSPTTSDKHSARKLNNMKIQKQIEPKQVSFKARLQKLEKKLNSNLQKFNLVSENGVVCDLKDQVLCFCGTHVSLIQNKESSLSCYHCQNKYHTQCMKRQPNDKICAYCHLQRIIPNKEVKKTLFVGLLEKGRKKT